MGMFDSVYIRCPECNGSVEFQSKAGECALCSFDAMNVPLAIAGDIDGDSRECPECGYIVEAVCRRTIEVYGK